METFEIYWSGYKNEKEYVVAYLFYEDCENMWAFRYNKDVFYEAIKKGFRPFPEFFDIEKTYTNPNLFRTFKNRLDKTIKLDSLDNLKQTDARTATDKVSVKHIGGTKQREKN